MKAGRLIAGAGLLGLLNTASADEPTIDYTSPREVHRALLEKVDGTLDKNTCETAVEEYQGPVIVFAESYPTDIQLNRRTETVWLKLIEIHNSLTVDEKKVKFLYLPLDDQMQLSDCSYFIEGKESGRIASPQTLFFEASDLHAGERLLFGKKDGPAKEEDISGFVEAYGKVIDHYY